MVQLQCLIVIMLGLTVSFRAIQILDSMGWKKILGIIIAIKENPPKEVIMSPIMKKIRKNHPFSNPVTR